MTKMRCMNCNFSFESQEGSKSVFCPNCGTKEKVIKEQSAEDLINEL